MVSLKKRSKEGVYLIRKTVREGNETCHLISAGAGAQLLHSRRPSIDEPIISLHEESKTDLATTFEAASVKAAERHIQRVNASHGVPTPLDADRLNQTIFNVDASHKIHEFVIGTPIFYKATLSLKSRYGNYLTFNDLQIDASSRLPVPATQFVIMNAENLADDGNMKYGNAVWIVVDNRRVLGSHYTGIGEARKLCPTLTKCAKAHLHKAHHIGRWILMNRDEPLGMMGKSCLHGDRIMLEQEWLFLSSPSSDMVTLYKTKNTIANVVENRNSSNKQSSGIAVDYFDPIEDCAWRVELMAQTDIGATDGRKRAELITRANSQLTSSVRTRWRVKDKLFGLLSEKINQAEDCLRINKTLGHRLSEEMEQEYLFKLYSALSDNKFVQPLFPPPSSRVGESEDPGSGKSTVESKHTPDTSLKSSPNFLRRVGSEEKSVGAKESSPVRGHIRKKVHYTNNSSNFNFNMNSNRCDNGLESTGSTYWKAAQKLLVRTDAWYVLDEAMKKYHDCPSTKLKHRSAIKIQQFVRAKCQFLGMTKHRMTNTDCRALLSLRKNGEWKVKFREELEMRRAVQKRERDSSIVSSFGGQRDREGEGVDRGPLVASFSSRLLANTMSKDTTRDGGRDREGGGEGRVPGKPREGEGEMGKGGIEEGGGLKGPGRSLQTTDFMTVTFPSTLLPKPMESPLQPPSSSPPQTRPVPLKPHRHAPFSSSMDSALISSARGMSDFHPSSPMHPNPRPHTAPTNTEGHGRPGRGVTAPPPISSTSPKDVATVPRISHMKMFDKQHRTSFKFENNEIKAYKLVEKDGKKDSFHLKSSSKSPTILKLKIDKEASIVESVDGRERMKMKEKEKERGNEKEKEKGREKAKDDNRDDAEEKEKREKSERRRLRHLLRHQRQEEREHERMKVVAKLGASSSNPSGLPSDVFQNIQAKVSRKTGFNFLRIVSVNFGRSF